MPSKYANKEASSFHIVDYNGTKLLFDSNSLYIYPVDEATANFLMSKYSQDYPKLNISSQEAVSATLKLKALNSLSDLSLQRNKLLSKARRKSLTSLWLNVAHVCNMECVYCFAEWGSYKKEKKLMSKDVAQKAVDFLVKNRGGSKLQIVFFGGEPFLNFPVVKYSVLYAEELAKKFGLGFSFQVITNGTILNEEMIDFMRTHYVTVQVSLDGPCYVNDKLRIFSGGKGSYETVYSNVLALRRGGVDCFVVRATITRYNRDIALILGHLRSLGFEDISLVPVMSDPEKPYSLRRQDISYIKAQYRVVANEIIESIKKNKSTDLLMFSKYVIQLRDRQKKKFFCGSGYNSLTVTPEGQIYQCHRLISTSKSAIGNAEDGIIAPEDLSLWGKLDVDNKESCKDCWARYLCGGGCAASALDTNGDIMVPDNTMCEITKAVIENALILYYFINTLPKGSVNITYQPDNLNCAQPNA